MTGANSRRLPRLILSGRGRRHRLEFRRVQKRTVPQTDLLPAGCPALEARSPRSSNTATRVVDPSPRCRHRPAALELAPPPGRGQRHGPRAVRRQGHWRRISGKQRVTPRPSAIVRRTARSISGGRDDRGGLDPLTVHPATRLSRWKRTVLGCTPSLPAIASVLIGTRDAMHSTARRRPTGSCSDLMMASPP